jgi:hypothetical protein
MKINLNIYKQLKERKNNVLKNTQCNCVYEMQCVKVRCNVYN